MSGQRGVNVVSSRGWLIGVVLASSGAVAAPRMALVALGDCRDPDLLRYARQFEERLSDRVGPQLLPEQQFQIRVGPPPTHTLDEVRRQVSTAENLFYNDRVADSLALLEQTLAELDRLPPGSERAKTFGDAQLIRGMALSAQRRRDASDDAFRAVLRVDPRHVMSPDAFSPTFRQRFEKLRAELARARKLRLTVQSQPPGATVYVDGFALGHTPATLDLVPGSYQLVVGRPDAFSFPHLVQLREDTSLRVDLAFEQTIPPSRAPCLQQPRDGHETPLGNALKLALLLEVDQLVVLRLDRPSAGPSWLSAAVLNAQTAQRTREGGIQLGGTRPGGDDLGELARFVVTGEAGERVVAVNPSNGQASVLALPAPVAVTQVQTGSTRTWRTPTGIALTATGAVALGLGIVFQLRANDSASKFNQAYAGGSAPLPSQVGTVDGYRSDSQTQQTLAYVGYAVGAAALGTGLWLWLTDGKAPNTAITAGPGSVALAGRF
ncbi:MAG TPA: PEGA domain-containing protein [Myxococcaceae bacterium]|nr:PEGA domain-containing protein [Myxococcaceae bacterium]